MESGRSRGNPLEKANAVSKLLFWWVFPFFLKGYRKDLEEDDLYDCALEDSSEYLGDSLQKEWEKELAKVKLGKTPSLKLAVIRTFGLSYVLVSVLCLIEECFIRIIQPICLGWVVMYFSKPGEISQAEAYWAAAGVCAAGFLYIVTHHPFFFGMMRTGMKLRIAACIIVYKKALKLSHSSMGKTTVGQMVNLLSNDVNRFDQSVIFLPYLVVGPVQTAIAMAVLWPHLNIATIAGLLVLILCIPLQSGMGKIFSKLRGATASLTDERVRLMNEIIAGMRVIKMYTWEVPFAKLVELARKKEVKVIQKTSLLRGLNIAVFFAASKLIVFICFLTHVLLGNRLESDTVFVSMTLFNNLRLTMTLFFPFAIAQWAESSISLSRIQKFLMLEEQDEVSDVNKVELKIAPEKCGVWMTDVTAKWNKDSEEPTLKDISLSVSPGDLLAVVGPVGSGKTSLLMSLLGELPTFAGEVKLRGEVAYSSQEPWAFAGSVRENVTFGKPFDKNKYNRVLRACALDKDIKQFPYGDQTLVGERGVSLSGGQKARVNLARALYLDADVFLMDDPLSAVDISVAKHLFEKCINGHLKNKVRILVTHQVQFLKTCPKILVLKDGKCLGLGSYDDLARNGLDVMSLMEADEEAQQKKRTSSFSSSHRSSLFGGEGQIPTSPTPSVDTHKPFFYESITSLSSSVDQDMNITTLSGTGGSVVEIPKQIEETRTSGAVDSRLYWDYLRAGGGVVSLFFLVLTNIVCQVVYSGSDYWLSMWTNYEEARNKAEYRNSSMAEDSWGNISTTTSTYDIQSSQNLPEWYITYVASDMNINIFVYTGMAVGLFVLSLVRTTIFFMMCMKASVLLHNRMFTSITRVPIDFFDNNPVGRILNRFTKDMGQIDDLLPLTYFDLLTILLSLLGILALVVSVSIWVTIPTVILTIVFYFLRKFYICTARDVKRLEGITRSPVFSHLSTSLYGITTIRAFKAQRKFERDFCYYQDHHTSAWFMFVSTTRWFGVVLDLLTASFISIVTVFLLSLESDTTGGNVGLAISSALLLSGMFQWGVRQSAELESQMTSVERVLEYSKLPWEANLTSAPDKKPPPEWPQKGSIVFEDMTLKYFHDKPPVLKNLHCHIKPQEKIGIVGRTGAGKSSVLAALFRMAEPEGSIFIDGIKTADIGLHDLRSKISIIPQDPVLFTGPVRRNIDPFAESTDEELWAVLREVQLKEVVDDLPGGLDTALSEGGTNFSVGQRQLICLARAILRKNKILVLDEATANVDHRTDALIQRTIREKFNHCTVLTIAHRLNTIMDSDRVLVLDAGQIMEFDEPYGLLKDATSIFYDMVKQTGRVMSQQLFEIAKQAHRNRTKMAARSISDIKDGKTPPHVVHDEDHFVRQQNINNARLSRSDSLEMTVRL